jgi:sugar-phosphatase
MGELVSVRGKAVLFAMDGTLVDSTKIVERAWGSWAARHNVMVPIDEIRNGKPAPEGFLHAAAYLGVAPEECIVFEDTRPGIDAGLNTGMQVVGLLTTCSSEQLRHWLLIFDFRDVEIQAESGSLRIELRIQSQTGVDGGMKIGGRS